MHHPPPSPPNLSLSPFRRQSGAAPMMAGALLTDTQTKSVERFVLPSTAYTSRPTAFA